MHRVMNTTPHHVHFWMNVIESDFKTMGLFTKRVIDIIKQENN